MFLLLVNFVGGFLLELMYKSLKSIRSSLTHLHDFQLLVLLPITFFCVYQKDKSSESKVKFRQTSNCCKRFLEDAKLACANETEKSITSQKLGSRNFWQIANRIANSSTKGNLLYLLHSMTRRYCFLHLIKQNC